jgi:hypothetical protein
MVDAGTTGDWIQASLMMAGFGSAAWWVMRTLQRAERRSLAVTGWARSEVPATGEVLGHARAQELVQRDAVPAGRVERAARPVRDLQHALSLPSS